MLHRSKHGLRVTIHHWYLVWALWTECQLVFVNIGSEKVNEEVTSSCEHLASDSYGLCLFTTVDEKDNIAGGMNFDDRGFVVLFLLGR